MTALSPEMVYPLTTEEFFYKFIPAHNKIFSDENPFSPSPFAPSAEYRRILFDWDYKYQVEPPLLDAVVSAARRIGDSGFYLYADSVDDIAFYIPFSAVDIYINRRTPLTKITAFEQILISPKGAWGIMTSHETHMLLGSSTAFSQHFKLLYSEVDQQVDTFLGFWQDIQENTQVSVAQWLPDLMEQIYGEEATKLLERFKLL